MPAYIIHACITYVCTHEDIMKHISLPIYLDTYIDSCIFAYINTYGFLPPYTCTYIHTYMMHAQILASIDL